ncbi:hypothetical protein [Pseudomonas caspiana]|nr:hypothetical protein [Pseudomonas caspiana]
MDKLKRVVIFPVLAGTRYFFIVRFARSAHDASRNWTGVNRSRW